MIVKNRIFLCLLLVISVLCSVGWGGQSTPSKATTAIAFVNVNVIPMDRERVLVNQTVIIRDDRIAQIGPAAQVTIPNGAQRIDGKGKYLMPGLVDMHVHLATRNAAECLQQLHQFGTVEVGKRADLLLLDANPLQSVANLSKRAGVMVRGRWLPETELLTMLDAIARLHATPARQ